MPKEEVYNLRWDSELKEKVEEYAKSHGYDNMATFIRDAIREKMERN